MASCRSFCFVLAMAVAPATVKSQVDVTLLKLESDPMMLYGAGITTVQFYEGDLEQGALDLKARLMEVAKLNPWIGSHLVKQPPMVAMRYDEEMFPVDDVFEINMNMKLREDMPYNEMTKAGSSVGVDTGNALIKSGKPIFKITICPRGENGGGFAVVVSMSHAVADGYTYYAILNMLSCDAELYAMEVKRDDSLRDSLPEQVGKEAYASMISPGFCTICKYIGQALTAKSDPPVVRLIDKVKLAEMKVKAQKEEGAAAFISTNDIITAGFARAVKASEITMAMDFRGRAPGLTKKHAGCYHMGIVFNAETCESPNHIRNALNGEAPYSRPAVKKCCGGGNEFAIVSNWSSMSSKTGLTIKGCSLVLHMPFSTVEPIDTCVVFTAKPGEVGVMCFLQCGTPESLMRELPLGEAIGVAK